MTQALGPVGPFLYALILFTLGIGLPIITVLAIRFLYYRHVYLGRSRELDKLIWQLHRIATALELERACRFQPNSPVPRGTTPKPLPRRAPPPQCQPSNLRAARLPEP